MISRSDPEPRKTSGRHVQCVVCSELVLKRSAEYIEDAPGKPVRALCRACVKRLFGRETVERK